MLNLKWEALGMASTTKKSMEQFVYEELKKAILNRELAPGNQLIENIIAEKLNVSRTPIRSALKRLASEGLVNIVTNKGAFVIQPTIEEMVQAYEIRKELEIIGIKLGATKIDKSDIKRLKELINKEIIALNEKDINEYLLANKQFHMMVVKKSSNKFLMEFTEKIIDQINIYLIFYDAFYDVDMKTIISPKEHERIVELLTQKKIGILEKVITEHLESSLKGLQTKKNAYKSLEEIF